MTLLVCSQSGRAVNSEVFSAANLIALRENRPHVPPWAHRTIWDSPSSQPQKAMLASFIEQLETPHDEKPEELPHVAAEPIAVSDDAVNPDGLTFASDLLPSWFFGANVTMHDPEPVYLRHHGLPVEFAGRTPPPELNLNLQMSPAEYRELMPILCNHRITALTFGHVRMTRGIVSNLENSHGMINGNLDVKITLLFDWMETAEPDATHTYRLCIHGLQRMNIPGSIMEVR